MNKNKTQISIKMKEYMTDMNFSLIIAIVVIGTVLTVSSKYFLSVNNFLNMGLAASVTGIMAAGLTISMIMGAFDLSQYSVATLTSVIVAILMHNGVPTPILIVVALLVGCFCGLVNGVLVTVFKINPIISTLGTMATFRALCYIFTSSKILPLNNDFFSFLGLGRLFGIPTSIYVMAIVFLAFTFILKYTGFGRNVYAVGANSHASFLAGINVKKVRIGGLMLSSVSASIAGVLAASQVSSAIPSNGVGGEMEIATAVLLGGLSLSGGKGKLSGTFLGLLILVIINNGLTLLSVQSYYQMLVRGVILILAVLIDSVRGGGYE